MLPGAEFSFAHPFPALGLVDQLVQVAIGIRSDHQVHPGHLLEQPRPEPLSHAADDAQHIPRALVPLQLTHPPDHPLLGVIPHGAGIEQHDIGLGRILGPHVAGAAHDAEHQLGISHVHLATVGLEVDPLHDDVRAGP